MDRYRPTIVRSAAAAAVAVFLVAGGAFAANTLFAPASPASPNEAPVATLATDDVTLTVAATAEPAETSEPAEMAEPAETAEPTETAEPAETAEPTETAEPAETAEPTGAPGDDNGGHRGGSDD